MKTLMALLLVASLIAPSMGVGPVINLSQHSKPPVANLSGVSLDALQAWVTGSTDIPFVWQNPKFPKINVTDKIINKDIYTDPMWNYLHNWSVIVPPIPRA